MVKIYSDQNSQRISSHINAHPSRLSILHMNFHINALLVKLPNTSTIGLFSM